MTDHGAQPGPRAAGERIEYDRGGWVSGPSLGSPQAHARAAEHAALVHIATEHPAWHVWRRSDGRWVGECKPTPTSLAYLTAETAAELADRIDAESAS